MAGTCEVDEAIRQWMADHPSIISYIITNGDGIPIRKHERMSHKRAVHSAALLQGFYFKARQSIKELVSNENDLIYVRIRTKDKIEIIASQLPSGYMLIAMQNCGKEQIEYEEDLNNVPQENAEQE